MKQKAIAIDGPAAAGKSSVARLLAAELGFLYVDTGALYRAVGYAVLAAGGDPALEADVLARLPSLRLTLTHENGEQHVQVDGEDVSAAIRRPEMSMAASNVSKLPAVRAFLLQTQRSLAAASPVVMDGRDIGTVILPEAGLKVYLTASAEARTRRRLAEYAARGEAADYESLLAETQRRDEQDMHRAAAPLRPAEDSLLLDNTGMTLAETAHAIAELAKERFAL